ncbi:hypothetical protein YPPY54_4991, partial [Yersinia pestis PY-54]
PALNIQVRHGVTKYQIDLYSVVAMFQIPEALTRHGLAV